MSVNEVVIGVILSGPRLSAALLPLRVPPPLVVASAGGTAIAAAVELASGHLVVAALLVQLKTVLDNADGQLATFSGRGPSSGGTSTRRSTCSSTPLFAASQ